MFDANVPEKNKPFFDKHMIFQLSQISNHNQVNKKKKRESRSEPKVNKKSKFKLTLHEKQEQKKMAKYAFIHYTTQKLYKKDEEALHLKDHGLEAKNPSSFNFASVSKYLVKPDEEEPLHIPKFCWKVEQLIPLKDDDIYLKSFDKPEFWLLKGYKVLKGDNKFTLSSINTIEEHKNQEKEEDYDAYNKFSLDKDK